MTHTGAVVDGAGSPECGLAYRRVNVGLKVVVGARGADRAKDKVEEEEA